MSVGDLAVGEGVFPKGALLPTRYVVDLVTKLGLDGARALEAIPSGDDKVLAWLRREKTEAKLVASGS